MIWSGTLRKCWWIVFVSAVVAFAGALALIGCVDDQGRLPVDPLAAPSARSPIEISLKEHPLNPVLRIGESSTFDSGHAEYPSVVEVADSLWMFYSAFGGRRWTIATARSWDGIEWRKYGVVLSPDSTAGAWDGATIGSPSVIYDPVAPVTERFALYYAGKSDARYTGIGLAYSSDGIRWRRHGRVLQVGDGNDWDRAQIVDPAVIRVGAGYRMYYCGSSAEDGLFDVGVAFSDDGKNWVKHPDNPVYTVRDSAEGLYTVDVLPLDSNYLLFESSPDSAGCYHIFAVESTDGLSYDARTRKRVLSPGLEGDWDRFAVYGMDGILDGARLNLWFNGIPRGAVTRGGQIGVASAYIR
jgi:predicted GH43/DUF377 family glycosyl hydrolase